MIEEEESEFKTKASLAIENGNEESFRPILLGSTDVYTLPLVMQTCAW